MSSLERRDAWIALALALFVFLLLFMTEGTVAVGWDEPIYAENGERIVLWLGTFLRGLARADLSEALDPTAIGLSFGLNNEHPPIAKAISGLGWAFTRRWLPLPTAHRVGPMAMAAALAALIYIAVRQAGAGRPGAILGAAALMGMPRLFFHAHIAELDLPAAATWFFATWVFWRLSDRRDAWAWLGSGLAFGLALSTKISNVLIPIGLGLWVLADRQRRKRWDLWGRLALMPVLGLATVIALFPWLWTETIPKLIRWARFFTVSHYEIYQYYLGKTYLELPWHYPYVIVAATTPILLLALTVLGATRAFRPGPGRSAATLWLIHAGIMVAWFTRPGSRAFDSDRLLMPTYVFLAPLAGLGLDALLRWLQSHHASRITQYATRNTQYASRVTYCVLRNPILLILIALAPSAVAIAQLHPFELAYYSELVGGVRGAHRLKLETIYWATTYRAALPELNARAQPGATVWVMPNSWDVLYYYQKAGLLRDDLVMVRPPGWGSFYDDSGVNWVEGSIEEADFAIIEYRQTTFFDYVVAYMERHQPVWTLDYKGIPLVSLYQRQGER
ncbi:MAG: hypothetical protein GXP39_17520 [Chloroflexi bacterium]|nr:hypothetical protein [Chloroflexota bacterium]